MIMSSKPTIYHQYVWWYIADLDLTMAWHAKQHRQMKNTLDFECERLGQHG